MEEIGKLFFDTYALIEIIHGNPNYLKYRNLKIITSKLNLMELHYRIFSIYGIEYAEKAYQKFLQFVVDIPDEAIKKANIFKHAHKKQKLSYVDCIGYVLAKLHNVRFLTGDKEFERMKNVEFVK